MERQIATVAQVDVLADALGPCWRLMLFLGAYGPFRPEEQAGLRRKDVDLDELTIRVRMAAPEFATGCRTHGDTKSDAGKRIVVLPGSLQRDLERHLDWYAERGRTGCCSWGAVQVAQGPCCGGIAGGVPILRSPAHRAKPGDPLRGHPQGHDGAGWPVVREGGVDPPSLRPWASVGGREWAGRSCAGRAREVAPTVGNPSGADPVQDA